MPKKLTIKFPKGEFTVSDVRDLNDCTWVTANKAVQAAVAAKTIVATRSSTKTGQRGRPARLFKVA